MKNSLILFALAVAAFGSAQSQLPVYTVKSNGVTDSSVGRLAAALGVDQAQIRRDGAVSFMDSTNVNRVPSTLGAVLARTDEDGRMVNEQKLDINVLRALRPMDLGAARSQATRILGEAGLSTAGAEVITSYSTFDLVEVASGSRETFNLDAVVSYQFKLGGYELIGPGAKAKVQFGTNGEIAHFHYANRLLEKGPDVQLISKAEAERRAAVLYGNAKGLKLESRLVYFAPALNVAGVERIVPHYEIGGTMAVDGQIVPLRKVMVPATSDAPVARIEARVSGLQVNGDLNIVGGRAPYRVEWVSSSVPLSGHADESRRMTYSLAGVKAERLGTETLMARVTDADGLVSVARATVSVAPQRIADRKAQDILAFAPKMAGSANILGRDDVGIEWIDFGANANNTRAEFGARGVPVQFIWGELNAWEREFKDPVFGGTDTAVTDDVDLTFYTGHANGNGWVFKSRMDDTFLHFTEGRFGNSDMEWLVIAACGPLQAVEGGLSEVQRWHRTFHGLHSLMGYATVSFDDSEEGRRFVRYSNYGRFFWYAPETLVYSWYYTATEGQPSSVLYGAMGPVARDGSWNFYDYFWGRGSTGRDIQNAEISHYWILRGPC
jgi:hypothetical protein